MVRIRPAFTIAYSDVFENGTKSVHPGAVSLTLCLVKAGWIQGPGAAKKGIINRIRLVPAGPNEGTCAICAKDMSYDGDEEGLTRRTLLLFLSDHDEDYSAPPTGGFTTSNLIFRPESRQRTISMRLRSRGIRCFESSSVVIASIERV
ncbi:hypothetical protein Pmar_PMAR024841 [Perkinsus marinus ATCC 50983]|uniref:Uncharacterized protein n=1 Tax=Perkinsus marinus (strain ATCC 50983 / TXsc) TaxID=423536 RepID=C5LH03_PERM5|nr:hypothetical protein Pmar_PMAR024841 [Perkinsus marinus ATCC 50983]EER03974.1 hypothetical protein Pmar_PMAR024841 [Perkinsus marinus ATCC 50983]|eukprot:XP_002772158.1 hypothetical protein Pmar_PMAR024841 [Perkinsus marinus ATCC 50983]